MLLVAKPLFVIIVTIGSIIILSNSSYFVWKVITTVVMSINKLMSFCLPLLGFSGGMGGGHGAFSPNRRLYPPTCLSVKRKNGQNQSFSANFWIFAPSESHFAPSMPPQKIMVPHCSDSYIQLSTICYDLPRINEVGAKIDNSSHSMRRIMTYQTALTRFKVGSVVQRFMGLPRTREGHGSSPSRGACWDLISFHNSEFNRCGGID